MKKASGKKYNWQHYFKGLNERNIELLINLKRSMTFKDVSDTTIFSYQKDIKHYMLWLQERNIETLKATVDDLIDYFDSMKISEARKTRILSALNSMYKLNKKNYHCKENIVEKYRNK